MVIDLPAAQLDADLNSNTLQDIQHPEIGSIFWDEAGRGFQWVKFNTDVDVSGGDSVEYASVSFDSDSSQTDPILSDVQVSGQTSGGGNAIDGATAGAVLTSHSASTDGEVKWGWIQFRGFIENLTDASNGVASGDYVEPDSSNDGEWVATNAASGSADTERFAGAIAMEAASGGTFNAYLICR